MKTYDAIQVRQISGDAEIGVSETVPHAFEVFTTLNPFISIHFGNTASFKLGVCKKIDADNIPKPVFRIVQQSNGGDPTAVLPGISMTMQQNIGLGMDFPKEKLHVDGNIQIEGDLIVPKGYANQYNDTRLENIIKSMMSEIDSLKQKIEALESK